MLRAKEQTSEEVGTVTSMTVVGGVGNPAEKAEALPASSPPLYLLQLVKVLENGLFPKEAGGIKNCM